MTRNATRFITPLTLHTLSGRRVLVDTFAEGDDEATIHHIELARTVDAAVVAPATANLLAKMAHGVADDLLSTLLVSLAVPVVVAPAMNTRMWDHPATRRNLELLRDRGVTIVDPDSGWLAERESGPGRLAESVRIVAAALEAARRSTELAGKRVVVSAGPTREAIDPVRYIANRSSGKMGYALAAAAARRGARVVLVSGPVDLPAPYGVECVRVVSSEQMRGALLDAREGADLVLMAAAVADWIPRAAPSKIKKTGEAVTLTLEEGPDILSELGRERREKVLVGFAAETDDLRANAEAKLRRKNVDFIVANDVSRPGIGMEADDNEVTILGRDGGSWTVPRRSKSLVAEAILDRLIAEAPEALR